jgi:hypothetical protein
MKRIGVVIGTPLEDDRMRTLCLSLIICVLIRPVLIAQANDPLVATWTVNMAKSKYDPGPAPKSLTMTVKPSEQGYTITQDEVAGDGQQSHVVIILRPDGKEYPVEGRAATTVATTRINASTYERVTRVNGKVTLTSRTVVSTDGKTRTTTTTGTDAQGRPVHELVIYDRK